MGDTGPRVDDAATSQRSGERREAISKYEQYTGLASSEKMDERQLRLPNEAERRARTMDQISAVGEDG
jgi:hypothetical protein